jgi:hypothetical protein
MDRAKTHIAEVRRYVAISVMMVVCVAGCALSPRQPASSGSRHTHRFEQPPEQAAACFARNAEAHSTALAAEVRPGRDRAQVVVRVKNGVTYALADFERAGSGSTASIVLNVATSGRRNDLLDALVEGC